ncbi:MAG: OsmC family protein [Sporolactobacillus sp.]
MTLTANADGYTLESEHGTLELNKSGDFTPGDLLITAIAGCSGLVFKRLLANRSIHYEALTIDTDAERAVDEKPPRFIKVVVRMTLKGSHFDEQLIRRLFTHVEPNCTIAQSVKGAIDVDEQLTIVQEAVKEKG